MARNRGASNIVYARCRTSSTRVAVIAGLTQSIVLQPSHRFVDRLAIRYTCLQLHRQGLGVALKDI